MSFSKKFRSFAAWDKLHKGSTSRYVRAIRRKHSLRPDLPLKALSQLHLSRAGVAHRAWKLLSDDDKTLRERALQVLTRMDRGISLTHAMKDIAINRRDVIRQLGEALVKRGARWIVSKNNIIQRELPFYEHGQATRIIVRNQRDARRVSQYMAATKEVFKRKGDLSRLKQFEGKYIIDADGNKRYFETDPQKLFDIQERIEELELVPEWYRWA